MLREIIFNDWFTVLLLICILFIAAAKFLFSSRFTDFLSVLGNSKYLKIYLKEQKFIDTFDALLFLNLIISLTVFVIISFKTFNNIDNSEQLNMYLKFAVSIGSIILIKVLIDRLIGSLFEIDNLMDHYVFQKITFKNYIGLILLPINILLIYTVTPNKIMLCIIIGLLLFVNIIGFISSTKNNLKPIKNNFFYFILYICALEIAPYVILYKVFNNI